MDPQCTGDFFNARVTAHSALPGGTCATTGCGAESGACGVSTTIASATRRFSLANNASTSERCKLLRKAVLLVSVASVVAADAAAHDILDVEARHVP